MGQKNQRGDFVFESAVRITRRLEHQLARALRQRKARASGPWHCDQDHTSWKSGRVCQDGEWITRKEVARRRSRMPIQEQRWTHPKSVRPVAQWEARQGRKSAHLIGLKVVQDLVLIDQEDGRERQCEVHFANGGQFRRVGGRAFEIEMLELDAVQERAWNHRRRRGSPPSREDWITEPPLMPGMTCEEAERHETEHRQDSGSPLIWGEPWVDLDEALRVESPREREEPWSQARRDIACQISAWLDESESCVAEIEEEDRLFEEYLYDVLRGYDRQEESDSDWDGVPPAQCDCELCLAAREDEEEGVDHQAFDLDDSPYEVDDPPVEIDLRTFNAPKRERIKPPVRRVRRIKVA